MLEDLLERVRTEVGADARIVAANRVRKGGIAGFFSRQAFEVLVEPRAGDAHPVEPRANDARPFDRSPSPARTTDPDRIRATILDLADAVSDIEREDVIDLVDDHVVSTQSRDFADILDRFSRSIDPTPDELGTTDLLALERATGAVPAPLPNEPAEGTPRIADDEDLIAITTDTPEGVGPAFDRPFAPTFERPAAPAAGPAIVAGAREQARRAVRPHDVIDRYETRLSRMGVPARLIPRGVGQSELKGALVESLVRLPSPPRVPAGLGVVIAVVGTAAAPVHFARDLAVELHLDPDDVVLETREQLGDGIPPWLQMNDTETANARRRSWQRRDRPTIVACSLPPMSSSLKWAREMLDNLEPTITWAIVDAGWKREDIAHRVEELGGVDVLALDNLDDTVSPASALDLGLPIGRLAHEHASPLTWTELLLERMADDRARRGEAQS